MRRHQDRGSERCRGLSSRAEGVSLPIGSMGSSRTGAPRTGVRLGKLGRALRSFSKAFRPRSESSVIRCRVRCICSRSCSICCSRLSMYCSRSSRSSCIVASPPYHLAPPGPRCALLSLYSIGPGLSLVGCGYAPVGKSVQPVRGKAGAGVALEVSIPQQFIDQAIAFAPARVHAYADSRSSHHHVWGGLPKDLPSHV